MAFSLFFDCAERRRIAAVRAFAKHGQVCDVRRSFYLKFSIMIYHKFRFGFKANFKVLICRIFGHRINENPAHHWCERCGLAYEEAYHGIGEGYWMESGVIDKAMYDENGNYKRAIEIEGEDYPLRQVVFEYLIETGTDEQISRLRRKGKTLKEAINDPNILI